MHLPAFRHQLRFDPSFPYRPPTKASAPLRRIPRHRRGQDGLLHAPLGDDARRKRAVKRNGGGDDCGLAALSNTQKAPTLPSPTIWDGTETALHILCASSTRLTVWPKEFSMMYFTADEHRQIVKRLVAIPTKASGVADHKAGLEYTSLMICFLMHSKSAAESLLTLHQRTGDEWFPSTTGYLIVRSLFEVDVTSHYITRDPVKRSRRYIDFEYVIRKNTLEAVERHRASASSSWREYLQNPGQERVCTTWQRRSTTSKRMRYSTRIYLRLRMSMSC